MRELSNENVIHVIKENAQYLQFRKLLEYDDVIKHAYSVGLDVNFRTARVNKEMLPEDEYNKAIVDYKNPREFMINVVGHLKNGSDDSTLYAYTYTIIEGVGVSYGAPIIHSFIEEGSQAILCAYKNGEQVYTSTQGNRLGCFFDSRMITELLKGNWKVYKEKLITSRSTKENDVNDEFLYTFTDSTMQMICPTCYSTPKFYGIEPYRNISGNNVFVEIWIEDLFGAIQENDSVTPYTSIKIRNITRNEIEWSYWGRFGDDQWRFMQP